jgi:hypothetical protein
MSRTCETCIWWEAPGTHWSGDDGGLCRRHAPRPVIRDYPENDQLPGEPTWPSWPRTLHEEWCGEHRHKEPHA